MDGQLCMNQVLKVNWASKWPKFGAKNHYHVFVGDFGKDIEDCTLEEVFMPFGKISNCRVVRDCYTLESKGYAFVSFVNKSDAENAINSMNGKMLNGRVIRTNWSSRNSQSKPLMKNNDYQTGSFEELCSESSPTNCTVYCGGVVEGLTEQVVEKVFSPFGTFVKTRVFQNKGYAFIKFSTKEAAKTAIEAVNKTKINGYLVKCSWGNELGDPDNRTCQAAQTIAEANTATGQTYLHGKNSWYPCPPIPPLPYLPGLHSMNIGRAVGYNQYKRYHYQMVNIAHQMYNTTRQAAAIGKKLPTLRSMRASVY